MGKKVHKRGQNQSQSINRGYSKIDNNDDEELVQNKKKMSN